MRVQNKTSKVQELKLKEIVGDRCYSIYLNPFSETDLENQILLNPEVLSDEPIVDVTKEPDPIIVEEDVELEEKSDEPEPTVADSFICDICGVEFASARSLSAHKARSHKE